MQHSAFASISELRLRLPRSVPAARLEHNAYGVRQCNRATAYYIRAFIYIIDRVFCTDIRDMVHLSFRSVHIAVRTSTDTTLGSEAKTWLPLPCPGRHEETPPFARWTPVLEKYLHAYEERVNGPQLPRTSRRDL